MKGVEFQDDVSMGKNYVISYPLVFKNASKIILVSFWNKKVEKLSKLRFDARFHPSQHISPKIIHLVKEFE